MKWIALLLTFFCLCQGGSQPDIICPRGFNSYHDRCYYISTKSETFDRANLICKDLKSELITPVTCAAHIHLNAFLAFYRTKCRQLQNCSEFWAGIHKKGGDNWRTTNGVDIEKNDKCKQWAPFYPSNTSGSCVIVSYKESYKHKSLWRNTNCSLKFRYVCIKCPNGFYYVSEINECLYLNTKRGNWSTAREGCSQVKNGAQLVIIQDVFKQIALQRFLHPLIHGNRRCIGLEWPQAGNIVWIGGQTTNPIQCGTPFVWKPLGIDEIPLNYSNWAPGEPNCRYEYENCAIITGWRVHNYRWDDNPCPRQYCSVCEF